MKRIYINIIIVLLLLLQGCIKDDLSTCKTELLLRFRYTLNTEYANLFYPEVNRITVYIFDKNGKYVSNYSEQGAVLTNEYVMHIPLPRGKYHVVAYGGPLTTYNVGTLNSGASALNTTLVKGVTDMNDLHIELKNKDGETGFLYPASVPDNLYVGLDTESFSSMNDQRITDIYLTKNTNTIKVKINDPNYTDLPYEVYITDKDGRYHFDNSIDTTHSHFKYKPINTIHQPNYMEVDLKKMRLMLENSPMLVIKQSGSTRSPLRNNPDIIYNKNMIDQILDTGKYSTQEDLDREDEYLFEITFPSTDLSTGIIVSVNGWVINNIKPEL